MFRYTALFLLLFSFSSSAANDWFKIIQAEDHRQNTDKVLTRTLKQKDVKLVRRALLALARIGDPQFAKDVYPLLKHKKPAVRADAAFALGFMKGDHTSKKLKELLRREKVSSVRAHLYLALARQGGEKIGQFLLKQLLRKNLSQVELASIAQGLGLMLTYTDKELVLGEKHIKKLIKYSLNKDNDSPSFAFALSRYKKQWSKKTSNFLIKKFHKAKNPQAAALLARSLSRIDHPEKVSTLKSQLKLTRHLGKRVELIRGLPSADYLPPSYFYHNNVQLVAQAFELVRKKVKIPKLLIPKIKAILDGDFPPWHKAEALTALVKLSPELAKKYIENIVFQKEHNELKIAAIFSLGDLRDEKTLLAIAQNQDHKIAAAALEGLTKIESFSDPDLLRLVLAKNLLRANEATTYFSCELIIQHKLSEMAPELASSYDLNVEGKTAILRALGVVGGMEQIPLIETALKDPIKQVVETAYHTYKQIIGTPPETKIPLNSTITTTTPSAEKLKEATQSIVILETTKGMIVLKMLKQAPLTASKFLKLIKSEFYNDLSFHRVVPNFVIQGGDPDGTGFGGPDELMRDEISQLSHIRGTVGIATAGKDTGGSQFFINHAPNLHLDGNYTVFAKVIKGMKVVDQIAPGDRILRTFWKRYTSL